MSENATPLCSREWLHESMARAEMATSVTLPIEQFRDLIFQAEVCINTTGELSAANARIAELEKDAARYRWLRLAGDVSWAIRRDMPGDGLVDLYCDAPPYILCEQESIDAAIDAAMRAKEKP